MDIETLRILWVVAGFPLGAVVIGVLSEIFSRDCDGLSKIVFGCIGSLSVYTYLIGGL